MNISIATLDDLEEIVSIYNSAIPSEAATADLSPVALVDRLDWFDKHNSKLPIWTAKENELIIGWLSLQDFYPRKAWNITAELSIYISIEHHGKGVGSSLMEHALDHCKKVGIEKVIGLIFSHNAGSSALFEKFGFSEWGLLPQVTKMTSTYRDIKIVGKSL